MIIEVNNEQEMKIFGEKIGKSLCGNETIELLGDVGAGKTTLAKGIARGCDVEDQIQSPTFTISRVYERKSGGLFAHYDFYRLNSAGIMSDDLQESLDANDVITVVEWAKIIDNVLPEDRIRINISALSDTSRKVEISAGGKKSNKLIEVLA